MTITSPSKPKGRPRQFDLNQALHQALLLFWRKGYAQTSIADLCSAMNINPPSLYAAFGNKTQLYCLSAEYYVRQYWSSVLAQLDVHTDINVAVAQFFQAAIDVLLLPDVPSGCVQLPVAWQTDVPEIREWAQQTRDYCMTRLRNRISRAVSDKQLAPHTDIELLATLLHIYLEGLSAQAYSGNHDTLRQAAAHATTLLRDFKAA